jgi:7-cyano-7-deazaguanine reductase
MIERNYYLPRSGPMPRPKDLAEAVEALRQEAFPAPAVKRVILHAKEFTAICPRTGQPDFGEVTVEYEPNQLCLESKAFKFYLWAFRDEGAYCESLAARIADDLFEVLKPRFPARGGEAVPPRRNRAGSRSHALWRRIICRMGYNGTRRGHKCAHFGNSPDTILVAEVGDSYVEIQGKSELPT